MRVVVMLTVLWLGCPGAAQSLAGEVVTVVEADGAGRQRVMLTAWTNERLTIEGEASRVLPLDEVVSLQFDRKLAARSGDESLVLLANGDRLVARATSVSDDVLTAAWKRGATQNDMKLPLETIAAVVFDLPAAKADRQRLFADLETLPPGDDIVLLVNGDRTQGEFEKLDGAFVELKGVTGPLKLDRSRVRAIRFNPELTSAPKVAGRRLVISLVDGSRLTATSAELQGSELKLTTTTRQVLSVPLAAVVSCHVYGSRVIPLADREPTEVSFVPYLAARWPLVKNANVLHGPLSLRGTEYGAGLGMHSRMSVTYALSGNEREFRATVGVDDCANGAGSVRFAVELDGKRTWTSDEITGRSAPLDIPPVAVRGAKRLTLVVDFGQKADVSDYADWCSAMLIVEPNSR
ncbi:MAG: NPCBM/NEW2 domain-containing protein [Planctomycetota bacterium]